MPETLTSTSTVSPWATQDPYLSRGFGVAQNLYLQQNGDTWTPRPQTWFTDPRFSASEQYGAASPLGATNRSTVATMTPETQKIIDSIRNLTNATGETYTSGQAFNVLNPAEQYASDVIAGDYLNKSTNPYLADMVTAANQAARDQFLTQDIPGLSWKFGRSGRTGSSGMGNAFNQLSAGYGRGVADIATTLYGTAYENERGRQQEMARFAPELLQARAEMYSTGLDAEDILNEQRQRELTDRVNQYNFEQKAPSEALDRFLRSVSGQFGSTTQKSEQVFKPEVWSQVLGGVLALEQAGILGDILGAGGNFVDWLGSVFPGA